MADENLKDRFTETTEDPMIFPGLAGGVFEKTITFLDRMEQIPYPLFFLTLGLVSFLLRPGASALLLFTFFVFDWLILVFLPLAGVSFGPSKPQTLLLFVLRVPFALLPAPWWWILQMVGTLLVLYAFGLEPTRIKLRHHHLDLNEGEANSRLRIFHFGDLHLERTTRREEQVVRWIDEYRPDLILYSGDVFSYSNVHDPVSHRQVINLFENINVPLGAFAVLGSPPVDVPDVIVPLYEALPIRLLRDENVQIQFEGRNINLVGLTCSHNPQKDGLHLNRLSSVEDVDLTILLYHSPDLAPSAAEVGIDLQFSGHTHGGQVRLPFFGAIFTSSLYGKRFESGRYKVDELTLYVTRGIGLEGRGAPRVRFLCPPECSLWEVNF